MPIIGALFSTKLPNSVWIRIVGVLLHLWSLDIFQAMGDHCGGWVEMEEETRLHNNLNMARIGLKGDGNRVPKEVPQHPQPY